MSSGGGDAKLFARVRYTRAIFSVAMFASKHSFIYTSALALAINFPNHILLAHIQHCTMLATSTRHNVHQRPPLSSIQSRLTLQSFTTGQSRRVAPGTQQRRKKGQEPFGKENRPEKDCRKYDDEQ